MTRLCITQNTDSLGKYRVEIALEGENRPRQTAISSFAFQVTSQDQEDLRWYLEDYLQFPHDPAAQIADRIERRMDSIGTQLFQAVFHSSDDTRDLWAEFRPHLHKTMVEIVTPVQEVASIPWELLRDPKTDTPLALRARAFVRAHPQAAQRPDLPETDDGAIRILLVICRPGAAQDVPFRSVASQLIKGLTEDAQAQFQLDVLRPPTFEQLSRALHTAKAEARPYHLVHFDGHGIYADLAEKGTAALWVKRFAPETFAAPRVGKHGYLLFESPQEQENMDLIDGSALGKLLVGTDVTVLVLNACRSAHAEVPSEPERVEKSDDIHSQVRAFGSLAQEVMHAGVAGVVAMRYNLYVVTAAQFVADLYATLTQGHTLGEAVTLGRKQLAADPQRTIAYNPRPLQDWCVPVVYEAAPLHIFPKPQRDRPLRITLSAGGATRGGHQLDERLPKAPDAGFFGRDETLLAIDRAFDTQSIVLLHSYAGSGKTSTVAEFARWYSLTGGVDGPVLFTSFESYRPLRSVLDQLAEIFERMLGQSGVEWLTLDDHQRLDVALQVMKQVPVLWIWDNVEPVTGFPAETDSAWSVAERRELTDFLRDARETKSKFLLTSRRDEREWLGDLPARIRVPPMPMQERVQLARALGEKNRRRMTDMDNWQPLLRFTQGNPLTITVVVGQALREGLNTKDQIDAFIARLRAGEAAFDDEGREGRSKSLGASLCYGFEHAFSDEERKQLALLYFFQGFVRASALLSMGNPGNDWSLSEVRDLTPEAAVALLNRAAEVGLLTPEGAGYYSVHPTLPWFFKSLFDQYFSSDVQGKVPGAALRATRAFVETMGAYGDYYLEQYGEGNRDTIVVLRNEEANLLHAWTLARSHGWWLASIATMQGLRILYDHAGRRAEWARLVDETLPDIVDPDTDGPLQGREEAWAVFTGYRVHLAREARQWEEAERLLSALVEWDHQRAEPALAAPPRMLDDSQRTAIRSLAVSLETLAIILREQSKAQCVALFEESLGLYQRLGNQALEAVCAFNLAYVYTGHVGDLDALRDPVKADHWFRHSLQLRDERDRLGRGKCYNQLGAVAYGRAQEAGVFGRPGGDRHFMDAVQFYNRAVDLLPPDAADDLGVAHRALGSFSRRDDVNRALEHYRKAIHYFETSGNLYLAAKVRLDVTESLYREGRAEDALQYAYAALRIYEDYGDRAAEEIQNAKRWIDWIVKGGEVL